MKDFNDIKTLWQSDSEQAIPSIEEIAASAKKERASMLFKNIAGIAALSVTLLVIGYIILFADFAYVTTKIGAAIAIISVIGGILMNSVLLKILMKTASIHVDNHSYLEQLQQYRKKQQFFQTKGINIYFLLLWLGLTLYMYEFYARDKQFGLIAYGLTMAWIAFNWFYLRPRIIKKQEHKLNSFISQVESISRQLDKEL
jgi:hypothetical protein